MTKNSDKENELEIFRKSLEGTEQKDFDGHTDFQNLSVKEKLIWLSELNYFKSLAKNVGAGEGT